MKKTKTGAKEANGGASPSQLIDARIAALGDWRPALAARRAYAAQQGGVRQSGRTVLNLEYAAHGPVTWHDGRTKFQRRTNKARSTAFFVDGHANYTAIYYDNRQGPWEYNPPPGAGFDYVWFEP
jgi:hypothetical protein